MICQLVDSRQQTCRLNSLTSHPCICQWGGLPGIYHYIYIVHVWCSKSLKGCLKGCKPDHAGLGDMTNGAFVVHFETLTKYLCITHNELVVCCCTVLQQSQPVILHCRPASSGPHSFSTHQLLQQGLCGPANCCSWQCLVVFLVYCFLNRAEHHDDRRALGTKNSCFQNFIFTAPLGVKPPLLTNADNVYKISRSRRHTGCSDWLVSHAFIITVENLGLTRRTSIGQHLHGTFSFQNLDQLQQQTSWIAHPAGLCHPERTEHARIWQHFSKTSHLYVTPPLTQTHHQQPLLPVLRLVLLNQCVDMLPNVICPW